MTTENDGEQREDDLAGYTVTHCRCGGAWQATPLPSAFPQLERLRCDSCGQEAVKAEYGLVALNAAIGNPTHANDPRRSMPL